jgi:acyl-coenzyme A synthetase/AMP-(fatty) acid ligase
MSAGEPLNPEVIKIWKGHFGLEIYDFYGQTERTATRTDTSGLLAATTT